tara:strand:+ start:260 stop:706 length:447 start_codon:yes stop_codon:yes gene_type:complete
MKHYFAELNDQNEVTRVIIFNHKACCYADGEHSETLGVQRCKEQCGPDGTWVETYRDSPKGEGRRGNFAGIGMTYMTGVQTIGVASTDIFIWQKPYDSWTVGISTAEWYAPIPVPSLTDDEIAANKNYIWDESAYQADNTQGWTLTDN